MSGHSRRRVACRYVTEPAVQKQKKATELAKGEGLGENKCDQSEIQHGPQAPMCDLQKIQLSTICPLSQSTHPCVPTRFDESHQVPVDERPADPNPYKLPSKSDVECISLDADTVSISSNESDCDIREVGAWISENASTTKGNRDGKNRNDFLANDLTEESGLFNEPKLSVSPTVPSLVSTLQNSKSCEDTTTNTDFIKNTQHANSVQIHSSKAAFLPPNKTGKEIDVSQAHSTFSSPQNDAGANSIQSRPKKLPGIKTTSLVYPKQTGIETLSRNSDIQRKSSSSVGHSTVPSDSQSKHDPCQNMGNKLSSKEFCCVFSWLTCIYGRQLQCSCTFAAGTTKPGQSYATGSSFPVNQLALERESCEEDVSLMKDFNTTNAVQNETTSTPRLRLRFKKIHESNINSEEPIQNKQKTNTYILKDSHAKRTPEPVLNSVLELKTLRTCNESATNLLDSQEKARHADIQLYKGNEEEKNMSMDSDIVSISSNKSDSDIMEADVSIPENIRQDLPPKQYISQEVTPSSPMSKSENVKICTNANLSKADHNKNILNNDDKKNPTQSEQNKMAMNKGGSFSVSPKQTDKLIGESIVHTKCSSSILYQDTRPEPPKKNCESILKVRDNIHNDCQDATFIDKVVRDTQIEEQNPLHPENTFGSDDDKFENESGEAGCVLDGIIYVACNEKFCEVREEHSLTSGIQEIPEQSLASLAISTEQRSQNLPLGDQEYQFNWTNQLSEIITQFPLGIRDINTDRSSLDKETAVISQEDYSKEAIDRCLDNFEDIIKQFDAKNTSFPCNDRNNYVLCSVMPSDNVSNDKTAEKVQNDACSKEFCCMLSWSAYVCGEQSKCLCTFVPHATNLGVDGKTICSQISHQSCKDTFPLIKNTKTSTDKKDTRTADLRSRPRRKTWGNISEKHIQKNWKSKEYVSGNRSRLGRRKFKTADNLEGKCKSASVSKNSALLRTRIVNQLDRKKKAQQTNIQFHKGKAQPPLSKMMDNTPGLVQCSLPHVNNTAGAENKPNTPVKKKRVSDPCVFPKEKLTALTNEVCFGLQAKSLPTLSQIDTATGRFKRFNKNTTLGKQDCSDQLPRTNQQNEHNQCTLPVEHEQNILEKSTIHVQECSSLDRIRQLRQRTKKPCKADLSGKALELGKTRLCSRSHWNAKHIDGLQLLPVKEDQIWFPKEAINCTPPSENNLDLQSKMCSPASQIVTWIKSSKNTCDSAVDVHEKASAVKQNITYHSQQLSKSELNDCGHRSHHKSKTTGKKTQRTKLGRPEPESFSESIETLASPKLDVMKSNKRGQPRKVSSKYVDNSQLYLKKVEQGPLTQLCKKPFVKKDRHSDLHLKLKIFRKDSSFSLKSETFGSSSSKQDFKIPSQMSEEVWPLHSANQHNLPKDMVRPKMQKRRSFVPGNSTIGVCSAKSNRSLKLNISEQIMSSEKALQQFSSPIAVVRDPSICEKNKSDSEISVQCFRNLEVHIQKVKENQLKRCQKTQVSVTTIDTRETFPDLETKTISQLRTLDVGQDLAKDNYSLVYKVNNTSSIVKQNSKGLRLLPVVQKLTEETYREIVSEDRHDSTNKSKEQTPSKKQSFPTEAIRIRSTSRRKSHSPGLDAQNTSVETTEAPSPSVCRLESSMTCDKSKVGTEKDKQSKCNLKSPIEKREDQEVTNLFQNIFAHKRSSSRRSYLQTETVSHLDSHLKISKNYHCVVENSNDEATPATQKAKFSDKYGKCGQKREYEHNLGHEEKKKQTLGQRKRKANNPASERDSSKRRKSGLSNQNALSDGKKPTCTREPSLNLEQTTGCLLPDINGATMSSIWDVSVVKEVIKASVPNQDIRCINQPLNEKSQELLYLSNKHYLNADSTELNLKKQGMEANVLKDKLTTGLYRNQMSPGPHVPAEKIKATVSSSLPVLKKSTEKASIEHDTKSMYNLNCHREKVASPTSDAAVKILGASCCDRPTGQSTHKEKTYVKQCVLKLFRLPLPLERQYLPDNTREIGNKHK